MSKFELPALPYDFNALEPSIDGRTMEIHCYPMKCKKCFQTKVWQVVVTKSMQDTNLQQVYRY